MVFIGVCVSDAGFTIDSTRLLSTPPPMNLNCQVCQSLRSLLPCRSKSALKIILVFSKINPKFGFKNLAFFVLLTPLN